MKALIVDDEPLARKYLRQLLEEHDITVLGEADSATQALLLNDDLKPEIIFLDIQMPGLTGLQLATALRQVEGAQPLLVFVTGYSEYAVTAFEHAALDYLVKPVDSARLGQTLTRARERLAAPITTDVEFPLTPLRRLPIRRDYSVLLLRVEEVRYAVSHEKRVVLHTANGEYRTYYTLSQLERLLPADSFLRIHDSCIVNLEAVEELLYLGSRSYAVQVAGGGQLPVSRTRFTLLQEKLGIGTT